MTSFARPAVPLLCQGQLVDGLGSVRIHVRGQGDGLTTRGAVGPGQTMVDPQVVGFSPDVGY